MADLVSYIIRKLLLAIPVILLATFIVFLMLYLTPGDPALALVSPRATVQDIQDVREKYGFDKPFVVQYGLFLWRLLHGDLGTSVTTATLNADVGAMILQRLPRTLELMAIGLTISYSIGIPLGVISALRQRAEEIRRSELNKALVHLGELSETQISTLEALTSGIVNKILHQPTVRLKARGANQGGATYVQTLCDLFALDEEELKLN